MKTSKHCPGLGLLGLLILAGGITLLADPEAFGSTTPEPSGPGHTRSRTDPRTDSRSILATSARTPRPRVAASPKDGGASGAAFEEAYKDPLAMHRQLGGKLENEGRWAQP